ncbi:MAG: hypothetical protein LBP59_06385 [Planctomycetaceae bacterium]|jgi:hypothetical protein|nr:hypothetical protein [Planctomycetaceae bacterium]
MREVLISSAFLFAYRQSAGGTPAIRWSVIQFKNDPQITQIKKNLKAKSLIPNSEFRIKKKARLPTR